MADYRIRQEWADANLVGKGWNGSDIAAWSYYTAAAASGAIGVISAGGQLLSSTQKTSNITKTESGGGNTTASASKATTATATVTGNGNLTAVAVPTEAGATTATVTGNGNLTTDISKATTATATVTGNGNLTAVAVPTEAGATTATVTGNGNLTSSVTKESSPIAYISGSGNIINLIYSYKEIEGATVSTGGHLLVSLDSDALDTNIRLLSFIREHENTNISVESLHGHNRRQYNV